MIGLGLGLITLGSGGGWALPSRVRFVFYGQSLTEGALTGAGVLDDFKAAIQAAYPGDYELDVREEGFSFYTSSNLKDEIDGLLASYPSPGSDGYVTYWVSEIVGNDVSNTRPYATAGAALTTIANNVDYIAAAVAAKGYIFVLCDQSFRDYSDTTFAQEQNGSRPYNVNIVRPRVSAAWKHPSGKPIVQHYDLIRNDYLTLLSADNVHLTTAGYAAMRQHWIDTVCKQVLTGVSPTELPANNAVETKSHIWLSDPGFPAGWNPITGNFVASSPIKDFGGDQHATGWSLDIVNKLNFQTSGGATTGNDSGVQPDYVLEHFSFVDNTIDNGIGVGKALLKWTGLDPSRLYTVKVGGSRATTGSRITRYIVTGSASSQQDLECINNTANQCTFANVAPSAGGEISLQIENTNNQFGYLSWANLTQLAN